VNIREILDRKLGALPPGPHLVGLRAVKSHIDAALRHLARGQKDLDETLFTDVIFRCNQAFEGSIKEAYRVLADKDPERTTPAQIEAFLASGNLLRKKVLDQFTTYRREWRNPSTHDYTLDFDEDEALVAVVSVTVFAIVLSDQIAAKLAFNASLNGKSPSISDAERQRPLLDLVTSKIVSFARDYVERDVQRPTAAHRLEGALAGYLNNALSALPSLAVSQWVRLGQGEADILIEREGEKIVIEFKIISGPVSRNQTHNFAIQASRYLQETDVAGAVVLAYSQSFRDYSVKRVFGVSERVRIVTTDNGLARRA
jgi:hypothetical protein